MKLLRLPVRKSASSSQSASCMSTWLRGCCILSLKPMSSASLGLAGSSAQYPAGGSRLTVRPASVKVSADASALMAVSARIAPIPTLLDPRMSMLLPSPSHAPALRFGARVLPSPTSWARGKQVLSANSPSPAFGREREGPGAKRWEDEGQPASARVELDHQVGFHRHGIGHVRALRRAD